VPDVSDGDFQMTTATIIAVSLDRGHHFSKTNALAIRLVEGLGVDGDAHAGVTVKHRSRVRRDPTQPNLRQVHLVHRELFDELRAKGFAISPGDIGENVTTSGIDLLALPRGARLKLGASAIVEVTGLRNPCIQLNTFRDGLMDAVLDKATPSPSNCRRCRTARWSRCKAADKVSCQKTPDSPATKKQDGHRTGLLRPSSA